MKKTEIIFTLSQDSNIHYARDGGQICAKTLKLKPPSIKNLELAMELKQTVMQALQYNTRSFADVNISNVANDDVSQNDFTIDKKMIVTVLFSSNIPMKNLINTFNSLLVKVCTLDNSEKNLTSLMIGELCEDDWTDLLGDFLVNFTMPSLLAGLNTK